MREAIWNGEGWGEYGLNNEDKLISKVINKVEHDYDEDILKIIFTDNTYLKIETSEFAFAYLHSKEKESE